MPIPLAYLTLLLMPNFGLSCFSSILQEQLAQAVRGRDIADFTSGDILEVRMLVRACGLGNL